MSEPLVAGSVEIPLLVDLDGSLFAGDTLFETLMLALRSQPWVLLLLPFWLMGGKANLKKQLAERVSLNVASLPYRQPVVDYLQAQAEAGREIILCTGSWHQLAEDIAALFPWISSVVATDDTRNLTGRVKAEWACSTYGERAYDYLGNEAKDLKVWRHARRAIVVGGESLARQAAEVCELEERFETPRLSFKLILKAMRIHQWAKNALVFVPLVTAHQVANLSLLVVAVVAFLSLGLCASATYLLNDLFDLESDRLHRSKCRRPLAAGLLSIPQAVGLGVTLMAASAGLASSLNIYFAAALLSYLVTTVLYSFKLKKLQTVDVLVLASLFTIRVMAGAAAIVVEVSFWLLCFSMFIFLSLAMVKRVAELLQTIHEEAAGDEKIHGRGYFTQDVVILQSLGGASGFLAVFVFALYINSQEVIPLYAHPQLLWLMCPILGYWVMRLWILTARNQMNEDPISFAVKDLHSWVAVVLMGLVMAVATWL